MKLFFKVLKYSPFFTSILFSQIIKADDLKLSLKKVKFKQTWRLQYMDPIYVEISGNQLFSSC